MRAALYGVEKEPGHLQSDDHLEQKKYTSNTKENDMEQKQQENNEEYYLIPINDLLNSNFFNIT